MTFTGNASLTQGFLFGLKKKKEDTKTLSVKTEELAQQAASLINQAYEEYRTTQQLATQ